MKKILFIVLSLCICFSGIAQNKKIKERPNILIILSDDQGWGDVGFNGCTDIPTPHLDQLAAEGVIFTQGYATHSYCSPSRAGLLSGRHQQRFGHENNLPYATADADDGFPLDQLMLSELLVKNDFHTCAIGKWHLGDSIAFWPNNRGFEDWFGFYGGGMNYWGVPKKNDPKSGVLRDGKVVPQSELTYLTDDFTKAAVQYIDKYSKDEKPFFMYLAYNAPHAPIQAPKKYLDKVKYIEDGNRAAYAAMVVGLDSGVGKVIEKLKETGEYENTLIFFYSDNGGHLHGARNAPFRGHKGMLFEGGIRVPFVCTWKAGLKGGEKYNEPISALDIFPSILAATGIHHPQPNQLDGVNIFPYLNGDMKNAPHDVLYWRYSEGAGYAVRKGNYKLVKSGYKQKRLLFDLKDDPYEHHNLVEAMPDKLKELQSLYEKWNQQLVPALWQDPHAVNVLKEEKHRQEIINRAMSGEKKN